MNNKKHLSIIFLLLSFISPLAVCFLRTDINAEVLKNLNYVYPYWYSSPYVYIWQVFPFAILFLFCRSKQVENHKYLLSGMIGGAIGAFLFSIVSFFLLTNHGMPGSTANIGMGLLALAMPILWVIAIILGFMVGLIIGRMGKSIFTHSEK